jgi:hypothetical protein
LLKMRKFSSHRNLKAAFAAFAILFLVMTSSPAAGSSVAEPSTASVSLPTPQWPSTFVPETFDGGGYGSTAETAVQAAIGDAEVTASGYGLFTCQLVEEPQVFPQPPGSLRAFTAQVKMRCTR